MPDKSYKIEGNNNNIAITINLKKKTSKIEEDNSLTLTDLTNAVNNKSSNIRKALDKVIEEF